MTLHFTTIVKPFVWNLLEKRMNEPVFCGMIEIDGYFWAIWLKAQSATGSKYSGRLQVTGHPDCCFDRLDWWLALSPPVSLGAFWTSFVAFWATKTNAARSAKSSLKQLRSLVVSTFKARIRIAARNCE